MAVQATPNRTPTVRTAQDHPLAIFAIVGFIMALALCVWAAWPSSPASEAARIESELESGKIAKVAEAPDGATIWAVRREGRTMYFSKGSLIEIPPPQGT